MEEELNAKLKNAKNVTIIMDAWTDAGGKSIILFNVIFPDRTMYPLEIIDGSLHRHTAEYLADLWRRNIDRIGRDKVASICSDNPSACSKARALVVATEGYKHILNLR